MRSLLILLMLLIPLSAQAGVKFDAGSYEGTTPIWDGTQFPLTVAMWVRIDSDVTAAIGNILTVNADAGTGDYNQFYIWYAILVYTGQRGNVALGNITIAGAMIQSKWQHVAFVLLSTSSRYIYIDGVPSVEGTVSHSSHTFTRGYIASSPDSGPAGTSDHSVAHFAVWNADMRNDIAGLAARVHPYKTSAFPVRYMPFDGDNLASSPRIRDRVGASIYFSYYGDEPAKTDSPPLQNPWPFYGRVRLGLPLWELASTKRFNRCREDEYVTT